MGHPELPMKAGTRALALAVVLTLSLGLAVPKTAHAHAPMGGGAGGLGDAILVLLGVGALELIIPDVRVEIESGDTSATLSWILPFTLAQVGSFDTARVLLRAGAEVHVESEEWLARGVFTGRIDALYPVVDWYGVGAYVEGGYAVGEDSGAPIVGGGLIVDAAGMINVLLMYRATLLETEVRSDITLNLEVPIPIHMLYQDDVF